MHNCLRPVLAEQCIYSSPVSQVPLDENRIWMNGSPMALVKIIEDDDRLAGFN